MVLVKNQLLPVLVGVWLPNLLFLAGGSYLFHRQR
jgi:lipopolysaccharide export LptBFGC system permease protein LptF